MTALTYELIKEACKAGGASVLTIVSELKPAAGEHAGIAPARYTVGTGKNSTPAYSYETRFIDGEPRSVVLIDSKGSQLNRIESALAHAIRDGDAELAKMPTIVVNYENFSVHDYELPHRFSDAHIRFGNVNSKPVTESPEYVNARNSTPADVTALMELSPISLSLGVWDATRKAYQVRIRSCVVGEIIGVLADQSSDGTKPSKRGAARKDDIAPSVKLGKDDMLALLKTQEVEMSEKTVNEIKKIANKLEKEGQLASASKLGLGSLPPALKELGTVSCSRIIRSQVLSFSALRQLRFGKGNEGDINCRALLAALALHGVALANEELYLRANCDLIEAAEPRIVLDGRYGNETEIDLFTPTTTRQILKEAIDKAAEVGIKWEGQKFQVAGDPRISKGISASDDEEE